MFGFAKKLVSTIESQATSYLNASSSANDGSSDGRQGLRVVSVDKGSLGAKYGFESWFDFIVAVNGYDITSFIQQTQSLDSNPYSNYEELQNQENHQNDQNSVDYTQLLNFLATEVNQMKADLTLTTWSAKGGITRDVVIPNSEFTNTENDQLDDISISPTKTISSQNSTFKTTQNSAFKRLQLTLQLTPLSTSSYVWHVLNVQPGSPAYVAGIMPDEFIINCEGGLLATGGEDLLGKVIISVYSKWKSQQLHRPSAVPNPYMPKVPESNKANDDSPCSIVLYVYNHDYDTVRPVTIYPNEHWGGRGLLGCDIGYGLLHKIPEVLGKFYKEEDDDADVDLSPGAVMFTNQQDEYSSPAPPSSENLLAPVVQAPSFALASQEILPPSRRKKHGKPAVAATDLSNYFEEAAAKSKEIDGDRKIDFGDKIPLPP
ncbi:hypothetical protein CANARDRAFT_179534, partial [[Candida] arabinofermentans NRRL YB-2248]